MVLCYFNLIKVYKFEEFAPLSLCRSSITRKPSRTRSRRALLMVLSDIFSSLAMVGMAGQQMNSHPKREAKNPGFMRVSSFLSHRCYSLNENETAFLGLLVQCRNSQNITSSSHTPPPHFLPHRFPWNPLEAAE